MCEDVATPPVYIPPAVAVPSPPSLHQSHLIHTADPDLCEQTTAPFGLSIHAWPVTAHESQKVLLPLYYVSPTAAQDRSVEAHEQNLRGVRPGWYVMGRPGMHYEVRLTLLNKLIMRKRRRNAIQAALRVDGRSVNSSVMFFRHRKIGDEFVWTGFVERRVMKEDGMYEKKTRRFMFEKCVGVEEGMEGEDVGSVRLEVRVGMERKNVNRKVGTESVNLTPGGVREREVEKEGKSVITGFGGVRKSRKEASKMGMGGLEVVEECGIKIFVRDEGWLRDRGIVGDHGKLFEGEWRTDPVGEEVVCIGESEQVAVEESYFETMPDVDFHF